MYTLTHTLHHTYHTHHTHYTSHSHHTPHISHATHHNHTPHTHTTHTLLLKRHWPTTTNMAPDYRPGDLSAPEVGAPEVGGATCRRWRRAQRGLMWSKRAGTQRAWLRLCLLWQFFVTHREPAADVWGNSASPYGWHWLSYWVSWVLCPINILGPLSTDTDLHQGTFMNDLCCCHIEIPNRRSMVRYPTESHYPGTGVCSRSYITWPEQGGDISMH